jgi:hypothetical protein
VKLDPKTTRWIEVALERIKYGEIVITAHDHRVVGVDTENGNGYTNQDTLKHGDTNVGEFSTALYWPGSISIGGNLKKG